MGNPNPIEHDRRQLRALVVEDSEFDYELVVDHLRQNGYRISAQRVEDEPGLRAALRERPWDLVVSDHSLPRFDSFRALEVVKDLSPDLPFLIVSAVIGEEAAVEAMLAGADDYIHKGQLGRFIPALERSLRAAHTRRMHRATEAALRENQARLSAVASNMPGVMFELDYELDSQAAQLLYVSEASAQFLGTDSQLLVENSNLFAELFTQGDFAQLMALLREHCTGSTTLRWQGRLDTRRLPPGERRARWIELAATPRLISPTRAAFDGVLIDITQQKRTEGLLAKSQAQLRELSAHLERVKEAERAAVAREIHDDIGGALAGLKVDLAWLRKRFADDPAALEKLTSMASLVDATVSASKRIMLELRPSILDYGIVPAIEWQVQEFQRRHAIECKCECNVEDLELDSETSTALFRILQEALTNISKHAHASRVEVQLFADAEMVSLEVRDDGIGLSATDLEKTQAFGIRGMCERIHNLSGWIDISGAPGPGTTLMLSVPRDRLVRALAVSRAA